MKFHFERKERYFVLRLYSDLLGDWIVERINGRKHTKLGGVRRDICPDRPSAVAHLLDLARHRIERRHYLLVEETRGFNP